MEERFHFRFFEPGDSASDFRKQERAFRIVLAGVVKVPDRERKFLVGEFAKVFVERREGVGFSLETFAFSVFGSEVFESELRRSSAVFPSEVGTEYENLSVFETRYVFRSVHIVW